MSEERLDAHERAVRHTISGIMSGRADVNRIMHRLFDQGFSDDEVKAILQEASRRMTAGGKAADHEWFNNTIWIGLALTVMALGVASAVGMPTHGRGVGIFYTAFLGGIAAIGYGVCGRLFRR